MSQHVIVYWPVQRCAIASLSQVSNFEGENGDVRYGDKKYLPIATSSTTEQFQAVRMTQFTIFFYEIQNIILYGPFFLCASHLVVCRQHF